MEQFEQLAKRMTKICFLYDFNVFWPVIELKIEKDRVNELQITIIIRCFVVDTLDPENKYRQYMAKKEKTLKTTPYPIEVTIWQRKHCFFKSLFLFLRKFIDDLNNTNRTNQTNRNDHNWYKQTICEKWMLFDSNHKVMNLTASTINIFFFLNL